MVDFFFVLSGFVIAYSYQNQIKTLNDCFRFQAKRFLRLYPLHFVMLILFLALEFCKYILEIKFGITSNVQAFTINNLSSFIYNLFLLHNIFLDGLTWNGPSWSISSEFYTYIIFALLSLFLYSKRKLFLISIFLIIAGSFYLLFTSDMSASNGFLRCLYSFFLGVIVNYIYSNVKFKSSSGLSYLFFCLAIFGVCLSKGENIIDINIFLPILFAITIFLLLTSPDDTALKKALRNKFLIRMGTISYGIYMIHILVWWIMIQFLRFIFKFPTLLDSRGMTEVIIEGQFVSSMIVLSGLGIIIFLANISYEYIEKPINKFRQKFY